MCNFGLNVHTLCANFGLNAHTPVQTPVRRMRVLVQRSIYVKSSSKCKMFKNILESTVHFTLHLILTLV